MHPWRETDTRRRQLAAAVAHRDRRHDRHPASTAAAMMFATVYRATLERSNRALDLRRISFQNGRGHLGALRPRRADHRVRLRLQRPAARDPHEPPRQPGVATAGGGPGRRAARHVGHRRAGGAAGPAHGRPQRSPAAGHAGPGGAGRRRARARWPRACRRRTGARRATAWPWCASRRASPGWSTRWAMCSTAATAGSASRASRPTASWWPSSSTPRAATIAARSRWWTARAASACWPRGS